MVHVSHQYSEQMIFGNLKNGTGVYLAIRAKNRFSFITV